MLNDYLLFNSIHELIERLDNAPKIENRETESERNDGNSSWCDTNSFKQACENMTNGKSYDELGDSVSDYKTNGSKEKQEQRLSVVGYNVVVPLYLQGVPNCMVTSKHVINNKIITIIYSCAVPWSVSTSEIMKTTTELMKDIISLEKKGYRVNLYIMESNDDKVGFMLKLKTDRETLNLKKLCFPLISPSMQRRIAFRIKERLYKTDITHSGYGGAGYDKTEIETCIKKILPQLTRYEVWNYSGKKFSK